MENKKEYILKDDAVSACYDGFADNRDDCAANIRALPSADVVAREPNDGETWQEVEVSQVGDRDMWVASMRCPVCGRYHNEVYNYGNPTDFARYCSFCGARIGKGGLHNG